MIICGKRKNQSFLCSFSSWRRIGHSGVVIELKYANDGDLEAACVEALKEIEEKKYAVGLGCRGMKKVICYGIAFWEKECMVVLG